MATFSARVTGKTITVTPYFDSSDNTTLNYGCVFKDISGEVVCSKNVLCTSSLITSATATDLENGTTYYIEITVYDDNGEIIETASLEATTYGLEIESGTEYSTSVEDVKVSYIDGMNSSASSQNPSASSDIKWYITTEDDKIVDSINSTSCDDTDTATITTDSILKPSTNYKLNAYISGVNFNGANDTVRTLSFTTAGCATNLALTTETTGETIYATVTWETTRGSDYTLEVTCVLFLDGVIKATKTTSTNGDILCFSGLEPGGNYTISFTAADNEGNTTSNNITYADTNSSGTISTPTHKLSMDNFQYSTRSVSCKASCNKALPSGAAIEYYLAKITADQSEPDVIINWSKSVAAGEIIKYTQLTHFTTYELRMRISGMKNVSGEYDTVVSRTFTAKQLMLHAERTKAYATSIQITFRASSYDNTISSGSDYNYDEDPITGTTIAFVHDECYATLNGKGVGYTVKYEDTSGTYSINKTLTYKGLFPVYGFKVYAAITDGVNIAYFSSIIQTTNEEGEEVDYQYFLPYIYHNGSWRMAPAFVYSNGSWHATSPECFQ